VRGLTNEEAELLSMTCEPGEPDDDSEGEPLSVGALAIGDALERRGLVVSVTVCGARFEADYFEATPLGRLALRIHNAASAASAVTT
jgi:hypothetical protein